MEEEGTVTLKFLIGVDGKVIQADIEKTSGFTRLDEAARNALSKCQFRPASDTPGVWNKRRSQLEGNPHVETQHHPRRCKRHPAHAERQFMG
jgi:TonB family protein